MTPRPRRPVSCLLPALTCTLSQAPDPATPHPPQHSVLQLAYLRQRPQATSAAVCTKGKGDLWETSGELGPSPDWLCCSLSDIFSMSLPSLVSECRSDVTHQIPLCFHEA